MDASAPERTWDPLDTDGPDPADWSEPVVVRVGGPTDLFDPAVDTPTIERVVAAMAATPRHSYLVLTERVKRLLALGNEGLPFPKNVWVGVPVHDDADVWRAEDLLRCNTPRAWVAAEPIEGPVPSLPVEMFAWVTCGTPAGAPPAALDAARDVRDRCRRAGVPFRYRTRAGDGPWEPAELDGVVWDGRPAGLGAR